VGGPQLPEVGDCGARDMTDPQSPDVGNCGADAA
jgi:hypothetical protein